MLKTAEFLFPKELERTPSSIKNILLIGSCVMELNKNLFRMYVKENINYDMIVYNNIPEIPKKSNEELNQYDFIFAQIPLRTILPDDAFESRNMIDPAYLSDIYNRGTSLIDLIVEKLVEYNNQTGILTLVANFIAPQVRITADLSSRFSSIDITKIIFDLNEYLANKLLGKHNVYCIDIDMIASSVGKYGILDDFFGFYSHNGYFLPGNIYGHDASAFEASLRIQSVPNPGDLYDEKMGSYIEALYRQLEVVYRTARQIDGVKIVIFDLDNTMWRGQIAEHYAPGQRWPSMHGWPIGIWDAIRHLRSRGILVSICSKNDFEVVRERWHNAVALAFVSLDDFVNPQINWRPKAENIKTILESVNLTAKNALFIDDNPVEREAVSAAFPAIRTLGADPYILRRALLWSAETQIATLTSESAKREGMIRGQIVRENEKSTSTREEFLNSLRSKITFEELSSIAQNIFSRTIELVNKTNQFNTTGKRWSTEEIASFLSSGGRCLTFCVEDRFVSYGLVGVAFVKGSSIVQYVMSCRVLGMDVELAAVEEIARSIRDSGQGSEVSADYIVTDSNGPSRDFYQRAGFAQSGDLWVLRQGKAEGLAPHVSIAWAGAVLAMADA